MLEKIAAHYGGHPFEPKYTCLTDMQIIVLYRQVFLNEKVAFENNVDRYIKPIMKALSEVLNDNAEYIAMFSDIKLFKQVKEMAEQKKYEKEVEENDLVSVLFETIRSVEQEIIVEDVQDNPIHEHLNEEFEEQVTGWVTARENLFESLRKGKVVD